MKPNDQAYQAARSAILKAIAERNCIIAGVPFNENNTDDFDAGEAVEHAKVAVDAAFAAQFPPSEDYAGLIAKLKDDYGFNATADDCIAAADAIEMLLAKLNSKPKPSEDYADIIRALRVMHGTVLEKTEKQFRDGVKETMPSKAADALEALLAERKSLTAAVLLSERQNEILTGDINRLRAERDALLARLAPVEDKALVEIVAKHFIKENKKSPYNCWKKAARDAIAAVRPHIETAERERCAKIADKYEGEWHSDTADACARAIAAAIRSRK